MFWFGKKERERNAPKVASFSSYDFNKEWFLVEMAFNVSSAEIDWSAIIVPDEKLDKENWQCAYLEQYLNKDGTEKERSGQSYRQHGRSEQHGNKKGGKCKEQKC